MKRRKFLSNSLIYSSSTAFFPTLIKGLSTEQTKVRLGFIGVGLRGQNHLEMAMYRSDVEIVAICDIDPKAIAIANKIIDPAIKYMANINMSAIFFLCAN